MPKLVRPDRESVGLLLHHPRLYGSKMTIPGSIAVGEWFALTRFKVLNGFVPFPAGHSGSSFT